MNLSESVWIKRVYGQGEVGGGKVWGGEGGVVEEEAQDVYLLPSDCGKDGQGGANIWAGSGPVRAPLVR